MKNYILVVGSMTRALMIRDTLHRTGISSEVIRTPKGMDPNGCGYSVHFNKDPEKALQLLERVNIPHGQLFEGRDT